MKMHTAVISAALIGLSAAIKINEQVAAQSISGEEAQLGVTEEGAFISQRAVAEREAQQGVTEGFVKLSEELIEELKNVPAAVPEGSLKTISEASEHVEEDLTQVREQLVQTKGSWKCVYTIKSYISGKMLTAQDRKCGPACWYTKWESPRPNQGVEYWYGKDDTQLFNIERSTRGNGIYDERGPTYWISSIKHDIPIAGTKDLNGLSVTVGNVPAWNGQNFTKYDMRTASHWTANWVLPPSSVANHFEMYVESMGWLKDETVCCNNYYPYVSNTHHYWQAEKRAFEIKPLYAISDSGEDCNIWSK